METQRPPARGAGPLGHHPSKEDPPSLTLSGSSQGDGLPPGARGIPCAIPGGKGGALPLAPPLHLVRNDKGETRGETGYQTKDDEGGAHRHGNGGKAYQIKETRSGRLPPRQGGPPVADSERFFLRRRPSSRGQRHPLRHTRRQRRCAAGCNPLPTRAERQGEYLW